MFAASDEQQRRDCEGPPYRMGAHLHHVGRLPRSCAWVKRQPVDIVFDLGYALSRKPRFLLNIAQTHRKLHEPEKA
jgi:hypothetical protein